MHIGTVTSGSPAFLMEIEEPGDAIQRRRRIVHVDLNGAGCQRGAIRHEADVGLHRHRASDIRPVLLAVSLLRKRRPVEVASGQAQPSQVMLSVLSVTRIGSSVPTWMPHLVKCE